MRLNGFGLVTIIGLIGVVACSASDDTSSRNPRGGSGGGQDGKSGSSSSSGGSAGQTSKGGSGGSNPASGGTSSTTGGSASSSGGTTSNGGSSSAGSGGSAGSAPACVPGTGTEDVGAGSILDKKTCLTWQKTKSSSPMNARQAAKYCDELSQDGLDDWRMPRPEELASWPGLAENGTAYITGPTYIPTNAASVEAGCKDNSHTCNIAKYNAGAPTCAWQGPANTGPIVCVHGTAASGSLDNNYSAASCAACSSHVSGEYKVADCIPYAN